jgi:hypothetical protein
MVTITDLAIAIVALDVAGRGNGQMNPPIAGMGCVRVAGMEAEGGQWRPKRYSPVLIDIGCGQNLSSEVVHALICRLILYCHSIALYHSAARRTLSASTCYEHLFLTRQYSPTKASAWEGIERGDLLSRPARFRSDQTRLHTDPCGCLPAYPTPVPLLGAPVYPSCCSRNPHRVPDR